MSETTPPSNSQPTNPPTSQPQQPAATNTAATNAAASPNLNSPPSAARASGLTPSPLQRAFYAAGQPSPTLASGSGGPSGEALQFAVEQGYLAAVSTTHAPPPVITPQQKLAGQAGIIQAIADSTGAAIANQLAAPVRTIAASADQCAQLVNQALTGALASAQSQCGSNYQCLANTLQAAAAAAAEYAAAGGCDMARAQTLAQAWAQQQLGSLSPVNAPTLQGSQASLSTFTIAPDLSTVSTYAAPPALTPPLGAAGLGVAPPAPPTPATPIQPKAPLQPFCDPALGVPCPHPPGPLANSTVDCTAPPPADPGPVPINAWPDLGPVPFNMPPVPPSFYTAGGHPECVYGQPTTRPGAIVAYNPFSGQAVYIVSAPAGAWLPGPAPNPGAAWAAAKAAQCLYSQQCQPGSGGSGGSGGSVGSGGNQTGTCPVCPVCSKPGCDCACFKKCQEQDPKPKVKWYVYKRTDGTCYVAEQTEPTEIEGDELQGEYTDETEAILVAQQCKKAKPPKPLPEAPVTPQAGGGVWCSTEVCNSIDATLGVVTIPELAAQPWIYSALLNGANYDPDSDQSLQGSPFLVRLVIGTFKGVAGSIAVSIGSFLRGMFCPSSGQSPAFFSINLYRTVVGFLRIFIGPVADDLEIEPGYSSHYLCPQRIPTSAEADAAYLSKSIDTGLWSCWVRANNDCDEPRLKIIDSKRSRLGVGELVALFMRGEIDHPTYYDSMRQLGFLYEQQADQYLTLANQIPPVSELVRMMARDVADEGLVTKFKMDTDFGKKWQGQLKEWGKNQGVGDLFAKYEWRAHWSIPAPGQLYDMYHRLRGLDPADPNYVDLSTIKTALEQQDILPYWIGKFIAISFRPLTRIDAGRAYELSAIDETRLKRSFTDLGYNDEDADTMVKFKKRQLGVRMRTLPPVSLYKKGLIPRNTAQGMLAADGYDAALITSALDYAQKLAAASTTAACVKSLKKRYMLGEVTQAQLAGELVGLNMDAFQANATAQAWQCERSARGKLASVAILCKWFKQNLINQGDYVTRLSNLGWHAAEIANHIQVCKNEIDAEKLKQQLAEQKQQEQAAKQAAALAAKLAREQQQQAEKLARLALKEAKLTRRQFQRITEAAKYMVKAGVLDFATAYNQIISAINTGLVVYQLDGQAAIDAALKAAQSLTAKNFADYPMLAEQAEKAEWLSFQAAVIDGSEML